MTKTCKMCGGNVRRHRRSRAEWASAKYCSVKCMVADPEKRKNFAEKMKGRPSWNKGNKGLKEWMNISGLKGTPWNKGRIGIHSAETLERNRQAHLGKVPPNKGKPMSEVQKRKLSAAKLGKKGPDSNAWRGGRTAEHTLIRGSLEYKRWRTGVFRRDDYSCQQCGVRSQKGLGRIVLHADHIKPFALHPELRFDVNNGRTLCEPCHKQTDTYAGRTKTSPKPVSPFL